MSSPVMTKMAAGGWKARTGSLDGVVTSMAESSSMVRFLKGGKVATVCGWASAGRGANRAKVKIRSVARGRSVRFYQGGTGQHAYNCACIHTEAPRLRRR